MTGFVGIISKSGSQNASIQKIAEAFSFTDNHKIGRNYQTENAFLQQTTLNKFMADKLFCEDHDVLIAIEGIILNSSELMLANETLFEAVKRLYLFEKEEFVSRLKGDFSGVVYDKCNHQWVVFTNQTGAKRIFYYQNNDFLLFSSELNALSEVMRILKIKLSLNKSAAYSILTSGFMLNQITYIDHVYRLMPGCLLSLNSKSVYLHSYFNLKEIQANSDKVSVSIDRIDTLFKQAIQRAFEKDKSYNLKHIATLSGGLDSRMTVLVAHKMGYSEQLNFTFSQANYLDEQIAKQIAIDHQHEFLFQSLDHGNYLQNIDEIVSYNDGLVLFSGAAHVLKACKNMNFENYGLIHTGLIGDAVLGSFLTKPFRTKPQVAASVYSSKLIHKAETYIASIQQQYPTEELYKFYGRGFMGAMNGNYYFDAFSQSVSPFLDIDFLSYCYSIPENLKFKQKIYIDWIASKHHEFAKYPWEKTGISPLLSLSYQKYLVPAYYKRMGLKVFDKLSGKMKSGMNPFDFWLNQNPKLALHFSDYFQQYIDLIDDSELRNDCIWLFQNGNWNERFQVLTLLSAIKLLFYKP